MKCPYTITNSRLKQSSNKKRRGQFKSINQSLNNSLLQDSKMSPNLSMNRSIGPDANTPFKLNENHLGSVFDQSMNKPWNLKYVVTEK